MSLSRLALALFAATWLSTGPPAAAAGFQWGNAADQDNGSLQVAIWYPSDSVPRVARFGPFHQTVALDGIVSGERHPLIVFSHGSGGSALDSRDTAIALAEAGFVVAAVTHAGDNFKDRSHAFDRQSLVDRPRHISRVIDFMLDAWPGRAAVDPSRVGIFGHSAGAATALISIGARADWMRVVEFCRTRPSDWGCRNARQAGASDPGPDAAETIASSDPRIKAAVVAAPALVAAFPPDGLSRATVPVQLWTASEDRIAPDGEAIRRALPGAPDFHSAQGAGHFAFLTRCEDALAASGAEFCRDPAGFDRARFLADFHRSVVAFYARHLQPGR